MEQSENACNEREIGKFEGNRPLWRQRHRSEDNIKMDLREMGRDPGD